MAEALVRPIYVRNIRELIMIAAVAVIRNRKVVGMTPSGNPWYSLSLLNFKCTQGRLQDHITALKTTVLERSVVARSQPSIVGPQFESQLFVIASSSRPKCLTLFGFNATVRYAGEGLGRHRELEKAL